MPNNKKDKVEERKAESALEVLERRIRDYKDKSMKEDTWFTTNNQLREDNFTKKTGKNYNMKTEVGVARSEKGKKVKKKKMPYSCFKCPEEFTAEAAAFLHCAEHHVCSSCHKLVVNKEKHILDRHERYPATLGF